MKSSKQYREPLMYAYLHFSAFDLDMVPLKTIKDNYMKIKGENPFFSFSMAPLKTTIFSFSLNTMSMQCDYLSFFTVNIPEDNSKITIYNTFGNLFLGEFSANDDGLISTNDLSKIIKLCRNFEIGLVPCSKCKRFISKKRIAGHNFCSVFCKKCFTGTVKENAQNESYN